ncbi:AI-2E family transporter [Dechloromonas sp. A34]|uniref:AI-2E family transporter n=1 Tax=Dechloromonas sp. A34 TaxID=447588 RepID=UPI002248B1D0|nr:AI-2E family transporter [Dechloromonas sp. A34]
MKIISTPGAGSRADSPSPSSPDAVAPSLSGHMPRSRRGLALTILATLAVIFALEWAQALIISLLVGILFSYTLNPIVVYLERIRVVRAVGTTIVMLSVICALALGAYGLSGQIQTILDQLPSAASKLSAGLARLNKGHGNTLQNVQNAASALEKATNQATGEAPTPTQKATRVVFDVPGLKLRDWLLAGSLGAVGLIGQTSMVLFLTFFLLLSGDTYKRKLVRLTGPSLSRRKITVHLLDDINESIQRYMFMLLATNVLVGLLTWIALRWIGLENAGAWAVAAGLLHIIPYFGPAVAAVGLGMAALIQFDDFATALIVVGASLVIATLVGTFVTTWMTGRIAKMNTAAVFVSLLFWAWLWGVWGMLLSIPITVIIKVVAQHVEELEAVAELLGE